VSEKEQLRNVYIYIGKDRESILSPPPPPDHHPLPFSLSKEAKEG